MMLFYTGGQRQRARECSRLEIAGHRRQIGAADRPAGGNSRRDASENAADWERVNFEKKREGEFLRSSQEGGLTIRNTENFKIFPSRNTR